MVFQGSCMQYATANGWQYALCLVCACALEHSGCCMQSTHFLLLQPFASSGALHAAIKSVAFTP